MSKVRGRRRSTASSAVTLPEPTPPAAREGVVLGVQRALARLPRWLRALLAGLLALGVTAALFPLVDYLYIVYFLTPETIIIPSFISSGAGLVMYLAGWLLMVGSAGDPPEMQVRPHSTLLIYWLIGLAALVITLALMLQGVSMLDVVAG